MIVTPKYRTLGNLTEAGRREQALFNFYAAERRAGADPLTANERMSEFAKRLDELYEQQQAAVKTEVERTND